MPNSQQQVRLAHAVVEGNTKSSMPVAAAKEIIRKMHGKKMDSLHEKAESPTKKVIRGMK